MAARPKFVRFEDVEFEELDQEFPSTSRQSHYTPSIEDLLYEIDVANYYKTLHNVNRVSSKSPRKAKRSVAVQTEPDVSGIPPSWFKAQHMLVDELHTSLGNLINSFFHSPQGTSSEFQRLKFFKYVDGFWESKYVPNVKIPASEADNSIYSGRLKCDLIHLFECAEKLKNITPYLDDELQNDQELFLEKIDSTKIASSRINMPQPIASTSSNFYLYYDSRSSSNSSIGGKSVKDFSCRSKIPRRPKQCGHGPSVPKASVCQSARFSGNPMGISEGCGKVKSEIGGNRIRRPLTPVADSCDGDGGTSRAGRCVRPKVAFHNAACQQRNEQENCQKSDIHPAHKNFIRRNIMALREPVIRPRANSGRSRCYRINI